MSPLKDPLAFEKVAWVRRDDAPASFDPQGIVIDLLPAAKMVVRLRCLCAALPSFFLCRSSAQGDGARATGNRGPEEQAPPGAGSSGGIPPRAPQRGRQQCARDRKRPSAVRARGDGSSRALPSRLAAPVLTPR